MEKSPSPPKKKDKDSQAPSSKPSISPSFLLFAFLVGALLIYLTSFPAKNESEILYSFFREQLEKDNLLQVTFTDTKIYGQFKEPPDAPAELNDEGKLETPKTKDGKPKELYKDFWLIRPDNLSDDEKQALNAELAENQVVVKRELPSENGLLIYYLISFALPIGFLIFIYIMFRRTREQFMGGGFLSGFSKSPAKEYESANLPITFKDVAGLEGVKRDLEEVVEFLKSPDKFRRLGGRVPKGVLLLGPPGTGKTLLSRAIAGEAGVPFYSVSGSEFIQMFVGVGASRVRDLFKTAKENSPAIIFIDEVDAVGRQRGAGLGGGHDEREQTLNQILSEMDGFTPSEAVIVVAATNRPDVLDPALLRPGRFDRHITVDRPTRQGREDIFKVHVRDVPLSDDVDLARMAAGTVGMTGADIRNLVNEAALWAARHDKNKVSMEDFEVARDKILMGSTRDDVLSGKEKEKTAYHEAGHALIAWLVEGADRLHKVTVIPRGRALGVTQTLPEEDRMNITESELRDRLAFALGGREAERIVYDETSAGAENDLERATALARRMVTRWGMSKRLGPVSYKLSSEDPFLGREMHEQRQFSEHTMQIIDEEVAKILHRAEEQAKQLLTENREKLDAIANGLIDREELSEQDIVELIGPSIQHRRDEATAAAAAENGHPAGHDKSADSKADAAAEGSDK